jgi:hypothetical protein
VMDDDWVMLTAPGCDHPLHRVEIQGAMMALMSNGPWTGVERMDCGCTLELVRPAEFKRRSSI